MSFSAERFCPCISTRGPTCLAQVRGDKDLPKGRVMDPAPNRGGVRRVERTILAKKLFVGGLSWGTDDEGLRAAFEEFGPVTEARVIMDRETGRSRGFGFVGFDSDDDANKAQEAMDGAELDGRSIRVNPAEDKPSRGGGGGRGRF